MKVSILGTEYKIIEKTADESVELKNADGWCSFNFPIIHIEKYMYKTCEFNSEEERAEAAKERRKVVLRHEIIHAFMRESGIEFDDMSLEQRVQFFALQFPKMLKAFQQVEAL
jgi:hypothetical protein